MIREDAAMPVSRFCTLVGIPRRTYCRMQARLKAGQATMKGPWPSPSVDMVEKLLRDYMRKHPDYGHRRIHALLLADGHTTSSSTVLRAMQRLGRV
jgi:putative transposase